MRTVWGRCVLMSLVVGLSVACGTTREFTVDSRPAGALIIEHYEEQLDEDGLLETDGETPGTARMVFFDESPRYLTVQRRGYEPATVRVDRGSPETVSLTLDRIPEISDEPPDRESALDSDFVLLPVDVELQMRTGVGALGHLEPAPLAAARLSEELRDALESRLGAGRGRMRPAWTDGPEVLDGWDGINGGLHDVLRKLRLDMIPYLPRPPLLDPVEGFAEMREMVRPEEVPPSHLLYVWCRAVSETKSRKIGNVVSMLAGGVVEGYNPSYASVSNPAVFTPSSGAVLLFYVIDAATSEVVTLVPYPIHGDLTHDDAVGQVAELIARFPNLG